MKRNLITAALAFLLLAVPQIVQSVELTDTRKRTTSTTINMRDGAAAAYGSQIATDPADPTDLKTYIDEAVAPADERVPSTCADGQIPEWDTTPNPDAWVCAPAPSGTTNLAIGTRDADSVEVTSSTGTDVEIPSATGSLAGVQSAADKSKLDGVEANADVTDRANVYNQVKDILAAGTNVTLTDDDTGQTVTVNSTGGGGQNTPTNLGLASRDADSLDITSSNGDNVTVPAATTSLAGLFAAADKTSLNSAIISVGYSGPTQSIVVADVEGDTSNVSLGALEEFKGYNETTQRTYGRGDYTQIGTNWYWTNTTSVTHTNPSTQVPADTANFRVMAFLDNPAFTGNPTAPTPTGGDSDTSIATTAFVSTITDALAARITALETPTQDHTNRAAVSTDTTLEAAEVTAGTTSGTTTITTPQWAGQRYLFLGVPEDEDDITDITSGGLSVFGSWQRVTGVIEAHKWWRTTDTQNGFGSPFIYTITQ